MTENLTVSDIMNMTDGEVARTNSRLARKLVKRVALKIALTGAAVVAVTYVAKKMDETTD